MAKKQLYAFKTYEEFETVLDAFSSDDARLEYMKKMPPEKLLTASGSGWTVAHMAAFYGVLPAELITKDILFLKNDIGRTVAHALALSGTLPSKFLTVEILSIADIDGNTVAHSAIVGGIFPSKPPKAVLNLADSCGTTLAHTACDEGNFSLLRYFPGKVLMSADRYYNSIPLVAWAEKEIADDNLAAFAAMLDKTCIAFLKKKLPGFEKAIEASREEEARVREA